MECISSEATNICKEGQALSQNRGQQAVPVLRGSWACVTNTGDQGSAAHEVSTVLGNLRQRKCVVEGRNVPVGSFKTRKSRQPFRDSIRDESLRGQL